MVSHKMDVMNIVKYLRTIVVNRHHHPAVSNSEGRCSFKGD